MKLDVSKLPTNKELKVTEKVTFDPEVFICHKPLCEVKNAKVTLSAQRFEEFIYVTLNVTAKVSLECSYTLTKFDATLKDKDELHFAPYKDEEDDDLIEYKGNVINMDDYIFNIISAAVPTSPKAPGAVMNSKDKGYRVISEDELKKELEEESSSPFDALKDLEF